MRRVEWGLALLLVLSAGAGCQSNSPKAQGPPPQPPPGMVEVLQGPHIWIRGAVQQPVVAWTEGIRLSGALAEAGYIGQGDPFWISVLRQGKLVHRVSPRSILNGTKDPLLLPYDVVEIRR